MTLTLAVLGDSIAYGQGASRPADTVGARLAASLTEAGTATDLRVLAVPGARSDALAAQTRAAVQAASDLAVVIIGANDLTHFVPPERAAGLLGEAVRTLVSASVSVVVLPAPDLSAVPWVPAQVRALVRAGSLALRQAQTRAALAAGARVATIDDRAAATFADVSMFSADRFHPSSRGYELITSVLRPAVFAAAADVSSQTG